jgi:hypothetical protein
MNARQLLVALRNDYKIPFSKELIMFVENEIVLIHNSFCLPRMHVYKIYAKRAELDEKSELVEGYDTLLNNLCNECIEDVEIVNIATKFNGYLVFIHNRFVFSILKIKGNNIDKAIKLKTTYAEKGLEDSGTLYYKTVNVKKN